MLNKRLNVHPQAMQFNSNIYNTIYYVMGKPL